MKTEMMKRTLLAAVTVCLLGYVTQAQQDTGPIQGNAGAASQPAGVTSGPGNPASSTSTLPNNSSAAGSTTGNDNPPANVAGPTDAARPKSAPGGNNPYDPYMEPPPLPKGNATLIGGTATSVDHVRNHLTLQPFGKGKKVKLELDQRTHIYRDGAETTILAIHKGDHVYADTMLDGTKVFAKNVRVMTDSTPAEVKGQVTSANPGQGTVSVQDQLSSKSVTFSVNNQTRYVATRGNAGASDVQPGSLVDVQFRPAGDNRVAEEITVLARPGDSYVFSGPVTHLDMRSGTMAIDNRSDEENYEIHFDPSKVSESRNLKVGSDVIARAVFDGKSYNATSVEVEQTAAGEQSKAQ